MPNAPRPAPRAARAATHRPSLAACLVPLVLATMLVACGAPQGPVGAPPPDDARLFLAVGAGAEAGLYALDATTGAAVRIGPWVAAENPTEAVGLAPAGPSQPLFAAFGFAVYRAPTDGAAPTLLNDEIGIFTEALAHDPLVGYLYVGINGSLFRHQASDGARVGEVSLTNRPDIEGLAFDPDARVLYGLARGAPEQQPQFRRELYALDVDDTTPAWRTVGDTGGHWANAGLAFDPDARVLYATGRYGDAGALYRIDPATGATTRVGATGLATAEGGLAWR